MRLELIKQRAERGEGASAEEVTALFEVIDDLVSRLNRAANTFGELETRLMQLRVERDEAIGRADLTKRDLDATDLTNRDKLANELEAAGQYEIATRIRGRQRPPNFRSGAELVAERDRAIRERDEAREALAKERDRARALAREVLGDEDD